MERNTVQLDIISEIVRRMRSHATAHDIYQEVIKEYPEIGKSTVYRNLQKLCKQGKLRKRTIPGMPDVYDTICTNHYHIRCTKCNKVFDADMDYISDLEKFIKDSHGFDITGHDILFTGICPECRKK